MSALPQEPIEDPKQLKKLLENHTAREAFEILAARVILANGRTVESHQPRRVREMNRKNSLIERDLEDIRTGRYGRIQLPSQEEARQALKQWREGAQRQPENPVRKIVLERKSPEVRE